MSTGEGGVSAVDVASAAVAAPGRVAVWLVHLPDGGLGDEAVRALADAVDDDTRRRAAALVRQPDRESTLAAHALLRGLIAPLVGRAPHDIAVVRSCRICGNTDHGKPSFGPDAPAQFNLAHSGRLVAVALAHPATPVGVDVELDSDATHWDALRPDVFSDREWSTDAADSEPARARTRAWVRKEAVVKTTGHGLALPLRRVLPVVGRADRTGQRSWTCELSVDDGRGIRRRLVRGWDLPPATTGRDYLAAVGFDGDTGDDDPTGRLTVTSWLLARDGRLTAKTNPPDMVWRHGSP